MEGSLEIKKPHPCKGRGYRGTTLIPAEHPQALKIRNVYKTAFPTNTLQKRSSGGKFDNLIEPGRTFSR